MASYVFETMTDAQAAAFTTTDTLTFSDPNATNTSIKVQYVVNPGDLSHPSSVTYVITDTNENISHTFGAGAFPIQGAAYQNGFLYAGGSGSVVRADRASL